MLDISVCLPYPSPFSLIISITSFFFSFSFYFEWFPNNCNPMVCNFVYSAFSVLFNETFISASTLCFPIISFIFFLLSSTNFSFSSIVLSSSFHLYISFLCFSFSQRDHAGCNLFKILCQIRGIISLLIYVCYLTSALRFLFLFLCIQPHLFLSTSL